MADVFISYAREDEKFVEDLTTELTARNLDCYYDGYLSTGEEWHPELMRQLNRAMVCIVVWSSHSAQSAFVKEEAERAVELGVYVPVSIDSNAHPPGRLSCFQIADWTSDWQTDERTWDDIEDRVRKTRQAHAEAGTLAWNAFRARLGGDFEGAADALAQAFSVFEALMSNDSKGLLEDTRKYQGATMKHLGAFARRAYDGSLRETLSGFSLLPVVDGVLTLSTDRVVELLKACNCEIEPELTVKDHIRVGLVIRPGADVDPKALVEMLNHERADHEGALDLHCFLVVVNTDVDKKVEGIDVAAQMAGLRARCLRWTTNESVNDLRTRLEATVLTLCNASHTGSQSVAPAPA